MCENQQPGVKSLSREAPYDALKRVFQPICFRFEAGAVVVIADQRMPDVRHVNANLVGPSGLQAAFDQAGDRRCILRSEPLLDLPVSDRMPAGGLHDSYFLPVALRSGQVGVDRALEAGWRSPYEGDIGSFQRACLSVIGKLRRKALVSQIGLGNDQKAARILVDPVNNAGAFDAANSGQTVAAMVDERIDKRSRPVASTRMNHETCGFVDDDEVIVFVNDGQRDVFALRLGVLRLRNCQGKPITLVDPVFRLNYFAPAYGDVAGLDQGLNSISAQRVQPARQDGIKALSGVISLNFICEVRSVFGRIFQGIGVHDST